MHREWAVGASPRQVPLKSSRSGVGEYLAHNGCSVTSMGYSNIPLSVRFAQSQVVPRAPRPDIWVVEFIFCPKFENKNFIIYKEVNP